MPRDYTPRRRTKTKRERERKVVPDTLRKLAGSQKENARRYLSGELVRALSRVEAHWRPGWDDPSHRSSSGHVTSARLFGPGRAPIAEEDAPDHYTLRFKTRGTIIGADGGMFVLGSHQLVLRDETFLLAIAHLRADGLCCENCAEMPYWHDMFSKVEEHRLKPGEVCHLNHLLRSPLGIWVTHSQAVVKAKVVPEEHVRIALALFDRTAWYEVDEPERPQPAKKKPGRPKTKVLKPLDSD